MTHVLNNGIPATKWIIRIADIYIYRESSLLYTKTGNYVVNIITCRRPLCKTNQRHPDGEDKYT